MKLKAVLPVICLVTFVMLAGCATTGESDQNAPVNTYNSHQNNAATTAAKMISPVT